VTGLGSAVFAFMAAGVFKTIGEAQDKICPPYKVYEPEKSAQKVYESLYQYYRQLYFAFGQPGKDEFGAVLPGLIHARTALRQGT
jgi:L-ribulokinase